MAWAMWCLIEEHPLFTFGMISYTIPLFFFSALTIQIPSKAYKGFQFKKNRPEVTLPFLCGLLKHETTLLLLMLNVQLN